VAAARRIYVDTVGASQKIRAALQYFLNFKIVRCIGGQCDACLAEKAERNRRTRAHFQKGAALMKLSLLTLVLIAAAATVSTPKRMRRTIPGMRPIAVAP
jgi:hypothetical protein